MSRVRLTKDFYLDEFTRSETAARMGREVRVPADKLPRILALCENILQPLREDLRKSIFVQSGYRPAWLNKEVGGSKNSRHKDGEAADIVASGFAPIQVCRRIIALELPFDQVILEFDRWTHVSYSARHRRQVLTARKIDGRTVYLPGIVEK